MKMKASAGPGRHGVAHKFLLFPLVRQIQSKS